jgi:PAS domain S-box-containing protein
VTGSHVDITELRDTDVALGEDEQRLALVSDTVADVIFQIGVEQVGTYRFLSANAAFSRVTGLPLSAVVGRAVSDVIPEPSLSLVLSKYREAIEHRGIVQWEETTTYPNGRLTSEVRVAPVFDEMGVCTHLVGSMRDITARKHAERELARSHETALSLSQRLLEQQVGEQQRIADQLRLAELRNLALIEVLRRNNEALEEQVRLAREAMRHKSAFLANMSHELRTPLNGIMGFAELMYDGKVGPLAPHHREYLGDILASARHLLRLINDILDLAKVEFGRVQFVPEPLNLAEIVDEVCSVLSAFAQERRLHIEQDVEPLADIIADHAKVRQVIFNYLSNALKFSTEGGRVTVRVAADGPDCFRIEVRDHGVGVAPDDLKRLFVEFQQLDSGLAKEYAGTGLGLALTKRIVEAQGGSVGAESTPNVETRFFAVLPRQPKTVFSDAPSPHAVAEPSA